MLSRTDICRMMLIAVLAMGMGAPLIAQEAENISLANGIVARIRTTGPYASLKERAAAIDQAFAEVISTQDTQNPEVSLKEVDGIWHVFVGPVKVIGVYPAEAEANALPARQLAAIWAKNIGQRLPLTTPVSKMPAEATLPTIARASLSPEQPTAALPAEEEVPSAAEEEPAPMPRSAALLLVVDAFNVARNLPEEDYLLKREEIASNLMKNLRPFMALPVPAELAPAEEKPVAITSRATVGPPVVAPAEPAPALAEEEPVAAPEEALEYIPVPGITATSGIPEGHEDDPAYARVPQKHRIKAKFKYAQKPYQELAAQDVESARAIAELMRAARTAFAVGNFDECEGLLDHALLLLGAVPLEAPTE